MASGIKNMHGSFLGTGANIDIRTIGYRPSSVKIINVTSGDEAVWFEGMADTHAFKRVAAGAGAMIATGGITPLSDGFRLGADTDLNVSAQLVRFETIE